MTSPLEIQGVYEVAVRVRELKRAEPFYVEVLGLEPALRDERRNWLFMRAGDGGMVVLTEDPGEWPAQHFALRVAAEDLERAREALEARGIATQGPVRHDWMPALSLYFSDPDGNELELCAPLPRAGH